MKRDILKSGLIAGGIAIVFGAGNVGLSLYLDWKSRSKNPELFDRLVESGTMPKIFSWSRILMFALEVFVAVFLIVCVSYYIQNRKQQQISQ